MRIVYFTLIAFLTLSLSGCFIFRPYRVQVQQGNIISAAMVKKLKPGMTKQQVSFLLGTADIRDPLHPNTWYYVYTNEKDYQPRAQKVLVVHFSKGKLDKITGDYPPPTPLNNIPESQVAQS